MPRFVDPFPFGANVAKPKAAAKGKPRKKQSPAQRARNKRRFAQGS